MRLEENLSLSNLRMKLTLSMENLVGALCAEELQITTAMIDILSVVLSANNDWWIL